MCMRCGHQNQHQHHPVFPDAPVLAGFHSISLNPNSFTQCAALTLVWRNLFGSLNLSASPNCTLAHSQIHVPLALISRVCMYYPLHMQAMQQQQHPQLIYISRLQSCIFPAGMQRGQAQRRMNDQRMRKCAHFSIHKMKSLKSFNFNEVFSPFPPSASPSLVPSTIVQRRGGEGTECG